MKKFLILLTFIPSIVFAANEDAEIMRTELEQLKQRIIILEKSLKAKNDVRFNKVENAIAENKKETEALKNSHKNLNFVKSSGDLVKLGGKIHVDFANFDHDKKGRTTGFNIRKARLKSSGTLKKDWSYEVELDVAKDSSYLNDGYVIYHGLSPFSIKLGRFIQDFGANSNDEMPEKSPIFGLLNYAGTNGIKFSTYGEQYYASLGYATNNLGVKDERKDQSQTFFARIAMAPIKKDNAVLLIGGSSILHKAKSKDYKVKFSEGFETKLSDKAIVTGDIENIKNIKSFGGDVSAIYGPLSLQAEYIETKLNRRNNIKDNKLKGYYAQIAYSLTGESRPYDTMGAEIKSIRPKKEFDWQNDEYGAFELAFRYSDLDFNSGADIQKGEMENFSTSLNWYLNKNFSMMFSYILGKTDKNAVIPHNKPRIFLIRTKLDF